jgi:F-type H+-transporting ATPase subunit b
MQINWFIFWAQIFNFFILVVILQKVLYRPIINAMEKREKAISDRLTLAQDALEKADQKMKNYQELERDWNFKKSTRLVQAKAEVALLEQELLEKAKTKVNQNQTHWEVSLQRQRASFLEELRQRVLLETTKTISHVLRDLANQSLEEQVIKAFLAKIETLEQEQKQTLINQLLTSENLGITISSAFSIPLDLQQTISQFLQNQLATSIDLKFEIQPELICGIQLRAIDCKIAWSIEDYLKILEENLGQSFAKL